MKYVYLSAKVQNRIERLKKTGKAGQQLARKVAGIIADLTSGTVQHHRDAIDRYTKYGENRIKNCRKYELGCGYRLITLQRDAKTYIPFLGPHDECQRWLDNHSRMKGVITGKGAWFRLSETDAFSEEPGGMAAASRENFKDDRAAQISDKDLRRVFRGLVEAAQKHA